MLILLLSYYFYCDILYVYLLFIYYFIAPIFTAQQLSHVSILLVLKHSFHFSGSMGTAGRECNKTSMDTDGCDIMCCGRGYTTDVIQRVDKCECKFHWCCEVICKNCTKTVERHTCNGPNPTPPPRVKNNYIRFKRDNGL